MKILRIGQRKPVATPNTVIDPLERRHSANQKARKGPRLSGPERGKVIIETSIQGVLVAVAFGGQFR